MSLRRFCHNHAVWRSNQMKSSIGSCRSFAAPAMPTTALSRSDAAVGVRRAAAAETVASGGGGGPLTIQTRSAFWNPFQRDHVAKAVSKLAADQAEQSEQLVEASLAILRLTSSIELAPNELEALNNVVAMLFSDFSKTPSAQFDAVYSAMRIPSVVQNVELQAHLLVVLESILPEKLYLLFDEVEALRCLDDDAQVFQVRRFVHFLLGDMDLFDGNAVEIDVGDVLVELEHSVPCVCGTKAYLDVQAVADDMVLKGRLFSLIGAICKDFDKENTGLISLAEFKESLVRVLGEDGSAKLLEGVKPDPQGMIRYHHVSSLLTKKQ